MNSPLKGFIDGFRIQVSNHLQGSKRAIKMGNSICVSEAMWQLMKNADQCELQHLLSKIEVLDIGSMPSLFGQRPFMKPMLHEKAQ